MYLNRDLGGAIWFMSQPVAKITIDLMIILLEKLRKGTGLWKIVVSICNIFSRISHGSKVPSINSAHISTHTEATQTLLTWEL